MHVEAITQTVREHVAELRTAMKELSAELRSLENVLAILDGPAPTPARRPRTRAQRPANKDAADNVLAADADDVLSTEAITAAIGAGYIKTREIAEHLGVDPILVRDRLKEFQAEGFVTRFGDRASTTWSLTDASSS